MQIDAMHSSRLFIGETAQPVGLSPEVSEWLFAIGFWKSINSAINTLLDQFEEHSLEGESLLFVAAALRKVMDDIEGKPKIIDFVRGWDSGGREIRCEVCRQTLLQELSTMVSALEQANREGLEVTFDL